MMRDAIEKAARALYEANEAAHKASVEKLARMTGSTPQPHEPWLAWERISGFERLRYTKRSAAVVLAFLAAAEEPSNQMIMAALQAGLDFMKEKGVDGLSPWQDYPKPSESIKVCWRSAVSALRREIESGESA